MQMSFVFYDFFKNFVPMIASILCTLKLLLENIVPVME